MIEVLYFVPLVVGYFVTDRVIARWLTGSWWKQPSDLTNNSEVK